MKEASIGILFSPDKKSVLLIKRRDVPIWVLPGGGIDANESPERACEREFAEETGLQVKVARKVGTWLPINRLSSPAHVFECNALSTGIATPQAESQEVKFWPVDKLPKLFFFVHYDWLIHAQKNSPEPVTHRLSQLTYWICCKLIIQHPLLCLRYLLARFGYPINE